MSSEYVKVDPRRIRFRLDYIHDLKAEQMDGDWDIARRMVLADTDKFRSIEQHYTAGVPWRDTPLFKNIYEKRFAEGGMVRGCSDIEALVEQYNTRVDAMFDNIRQHGYQPYEVVPTGQRLVPTPGVFLARDGEIILSNQGNHRVAMAQLLEVPWIIVRILVRHTQFTESLEHVTVKEHIPELPPGALTIPAMTTKQERFAGYEAAKKQAPKGDVVELGTWLGAATVFLAAGVRDSESGSKLHAYDRFTWSDIHTYKAGGSVTIPMIEQFKLNMGALLPYVEVHAGEFSNHKWKGGAISLLVADGPKRFPEISQTLAEFGPHLIPDAVMAWQDFFYFPAYDLLMAFDTLERNGLINFERSVYPGTTAYFTCPRPLKAKQVSVDVLRGGEWTKKRVVELYGKWGPRFEGEGRPRFMCGAAMFLTDIGCVAEGEQLMRKLVQEHRELIEPKWQYFREKKPAYLTKYKQLFKAFD